MSYSDPAPGGSRTTFKTFLFMKTKNLVSAIAAIAVANPLGFTVNIETLEPVTTGYAVALSETQNSFGFDSLDHVIRVAQRTGAAVGGWYNSENGKYYFDATLIVASYTVAAELAQLNEQIAFYSLDENKEYFI